MFKTDFLDENTTVADILRGERVSKELVEAGLIVIL